MIRPTGTPVSYPPIALPNTGKRNVDAFSNLLSPNIPNGSVPVPADAETLVTGAFDREHADEPIDPRTSQVRTNAQPPTQSPTWEIATLGRVEDAGVDGSAAAVVAPASMTDVRSAVGPTRSAVPGSSPAVVLPVTPPCAAATTQSTGAAEARMRYDAPAVLQPSALHLPDAGSAFTAWLSQAHAGDPAQAAADRAGAVRTALVPSEIPVGHVAVENALARGVVEVHVRTSDGSVDVVAFPWHLSANSQLSWISTQADVGNAIPSALARVVTPVDVHPLLGERDLPPFVESLSASDHESNAIATAQVERTTEDSSAAASAPGSATTRPLPGAMWASRLVRWLEQHGRDAEVWIRDFSLDDASARTLARDIERVCRQHGIQLDRIIVNAREQWTASARTSPGDA